MKRFRLFAALFATALMFCRAAAAHAEVQKFINPCGGQQLCPSFQLVMTPPDGWVLDAQATKENNVQIMVPKGKTFATAQPLMYVRVFYHKDKQQTLDDFARVSNERWLAASAKAKIAALAAVARTNGKPGFLRFRAFGLDSDKDGNEFVLDVVMTGNSKKTLDRAEKDYVAFLKAN
jgi:hypothetical protein